MTLIWPPVRANPRELAIKTDMTTEFVNHPEASAKILEAVPLKRFGEASDIATMTAYLASEEAGYITGQVFGVDGGMAM